MGVKQRYRVGDKVKVAKDNDNAGYDSFRDKVLKVVSVATSTRQHPGYDTGVGQALYDLQTVSGEDIGSSLYDYELQRA